MPDKKKSKTPKTPEEIIKIHNDWKEKNDKKIMDKEVQLDLQLAKMMRTGASRKAKDARSERTGELIAFGILVEELFRAGGQEAPKKWEDGAKKHLSGRNLQRALSGFARLMPKLPSTGKSQEHGQ